MQYINEYNFNDGALLLATHDLSYVDVIKVIYHMSMCYSGLSELSPWHEVGLRLADDDVSHR